MAKIDNKSVFHTQAELSISKDCNASSSQAIREVLENDRELKKSLIELIDNYLKKGIKGSPGAISDWCKSTDIYEIITSDPTVLVKIRDLLLHFILKQELSSTIDLSSLYNKNLGEVLRGLIIGYFIGNNLIINGSELRTYKEKDDYENLRQAIRDLGDETLCAIQRSGIPLRDSVRQASSYDTIVVEF